MKRMLVFIMLAFAVLTACSETVYKIRPSGLDTFNENPITITWKGEAKEVQSFQTNVQVFSMNNRKDTYAALNKTYRMAMSTIGDRVFTRIDMENDGGASFRSAVSDGENTIIFNPDTEEIGFRINDPAAQSPLNRVFGQMTGLSRLNLSLIRQEASRLSLDLIEENDGGMKLLLLELPPALLPMQGSDTIISSRAVFDLSNDTLLETEVVMKLEDDTIITTTVEPVYEEVNGVPVKIGQVTIIDSKAPGLLEDVDPNIPYINSPDEIPTISASELAALEASGNVIEDADITYGNPADLSYVETIYEVYQDIEINNTPVQLFRLLQK